PARLRLRNDLARKPCLAHPGSARDDDPRRMALQELGDEPEFLVATYQRPAGRNSMSSTRHPATETESPSPLGLRQAIAKTLNSEPVKRSAAAASADAPPRYCPRVCPSGPGLADRPGDVANE